MVVAWSLLVGLPLLVAAQPGVLTEAEISQAFDTSASPRVIVKISTADRGECRTTHKVTAQVLKRAGDPRPRLNAKRSR
jgi:hypothetical protein